MRTLVFKLLLLLWTALFGFLSSQAKEDFSKTINRSFDVKANALVKVSNKFGKVHITSGSGSTVKIEVMITVDASSQQEAQKVIDRVNIDFTSSADLVAAVTSISGKWNKNKSKNLRIDYTINMPKSNALEVELKFGDCYLNALDGNAEIDINYGSLTVSGPLNGSSNDIDLSFSKARVKDVAKLDLDLQYSELNAESIIDLDADSQFSQLKVETVGKLDIDSQYDKVSFEMVDEMDGDMQFSNCEIGTLGRVLDVDNSYGGIEVSSIQAGFKRVSIENSFAPVKLGFAQGARFHLEGEMQFASMKYPDNSGITKKNKSNTAAYYEGDVGGGGDATVDIESQYGSVKIEMD